MLTSWLWHTRAGLGIGAAESQYRERNPGTQSVPAEENEYFSTNLQAKLCHFPLYFLLGGMNCQHEKGAFDAFSRKNNLWTSTGFMVGFLPQGRRDRREQPLVSVLG